MNNIKLKTKKAPSLGMPGGSKKKIPLILLFLVVLLVGGDWGANALMSTVDPTIEKTKGSRNGAAVVVFGDQESSSKALVTPHKKVLDDYGDVVTVEASTDSFDGEAIIKKTHKQLLDWGYKRVIILGIGLGGQLGTDLIDHDRINGRHFQFAVVLVDAQTNVDDTESGLSTAFFSWWHAGPMTDFIQSYASPGYPVSGWTAQLRYADSHLDYRPDAYIGIPMVFVQSENDSNVKKEAAANWQRIFGQGKGKIITVPGSDHAGLIKTVRPWSGALDKAFALVA